MTPWFVSFAVAALATTSAAQPLAGGEPMSAQVTRLACMTGEAMEIEVTSGQPFPVRNALTELQIGDLSSSLSRYGDDGDTHTLIFSFMRDQFLAISADANAVVRYNPSNGHDVWLIGAIDPASALDCDEVDEIRRLSD